MAIRLGRFIALAVVIAVLGTMALNHRATQLQSQLATRGGRSVPIAGSDSVAVVLAAARALWVDDSTRGATGGRDTVPRRVLQFERDSAGVLVTLVPQDPLAPGGGGGALIRVAPDGVARLVERYPGH